MFSGQIFADFCGYSTIARGLGYLLGYRFPINFNAPVHRRRRSRTSGSAGT